MTIDVTNRAITAAARFEVLAGCAIPSPLPGVLPGSYQITPAAASPAGYTWYEVNLDLERTHANAGEIVRSILTSLSTLATEGVLTDFRILNGQAWLHSVRTDAPLEQPFAEHAP